jgi:hypothetical protein
VQRASQQPGVEITTANANMTIFLVCMDGHGVKTQSPLVEEHGPSGGSSSRITAHLREQRHADDDDWT